MKPKPSTRPGDDMTRRRRLLRNFGIVIVFGYVACGTLMKVVRDELLPASPSIPASLRMMSWMVLIVVPMAMGPRVFARNAGRRQEEPGALRAVRSWRRR